MDFEVFVFGKCTCQDVDEIKRCLALKNCVAKCVCCFQNAESLSEILQKTCNMLLFCQNDQIDGLIAENINKLSNSKSVIDEQIVVFEKDDKKIVFLPIDARWQDSFAKTKLNEQANKFCQFRLFGLTEARLQEILQNLKSQLPNLQATTLEKGLLKFDLYISYSGTDDLIDDGLVKISTALKDYIFSDNSLDLNESVAALVNLKGLKLSICEGVTGGALCSQICLADSTALADGIIQFCAGQLNADNVYAQTLKLFGERDNIFAVNVQGEFQNGQFVCVYAIGNSRSIDVHKNTYRTADKKSAIEFAVNSIMFNIIKKLRQNSLGF